MIVRDDDNRLFDNEVADCYGVFIRKLGGYQKYYEWKAEISKLKKTHLKSLKLIKTKLLNQCQHIHKTLKITLTK